MWWVEEEKSGGGGGGGAAPPKKVAEALDRLSQAGRLVADVRLGADRLLEALFLAPQQPNHLHSSHTPFNLLLTQHSQITLHLLNLRTIGRQLEESGVLNESLRSRSNSWGLHMPLVCPDGAVVAYAWKRQLAGQAGASAVDRTRKLVVMNGIVNSETAYLSLIGIAIHKAVLDAVSFLYPRPHPNDKKLISKIHGNLLALKAFTDQKHRFFPHLDDATDAEPVSKKHCGSHLPTASSGEKLDEYSSLSDVLSNLEKEVPNVKVFTYERLDWLKRASSLPSSTNESTTEPSVHNFHSSTNFGQGTNSNAAPEKVAVIELLFPSVFRAVISLHPVGSTDPDAVSFFSSDEGGSYIQARGFSVHHVFKHITEHAAIALQYFLGLRNQKALHSLLHWVCGYQTLLSKVCSKCGRLLSMDKHSSLLLPPVYRPYRNFCVIKSTRTQQTASIGDQSMDPSHAYHIDCFVEEQ